MISKTLHHDASSQAGISLGGSGRAPRWASAAKSGIGTAVSSESNVWFTLSDGVVTEVFHPCVDTACIRDCGLLVTDRHAFFSDECRDTISKVEYVAQGVPAFRLKNACKQGRYRIEKEILSDPFRPTVLQQVFFEVSKGELSDYAVYVLLNPHLRNQQGPNRAWCGEFKGIPLLFAQSGSEVMALACSVPWLHRSVGFVGISDGWQDISQHKQMTWSYDRAENGNVAVCGEIDLLAEDGHFLLAISFGRDEDEAGHRARASLQQGFHAAQKVYVAQWTDWQGELAITDNASQDQRDLRRTSAAVIRCHEDKPFPGGIVASLANPWGQIKSEAKRGYHLIWPRDMIQAVGGLLAIGKHEDARRALDYLRTTQAANGHWTQNMRVSGAASLDGIQMDETALVILLLDLARREGVLTEKETAGYWPMIRQAVAYLVCHGPVTPLDRWEGEAGYFPSTMAVEIAALLVAAEMAPQVGEDRLAGYLLETADAWNDAIDRLTYVTGTELAHRSRVDGYYVRFARPDQMRFDTPAAGEVTIKNHPPGSGRHNAADIVSPDMLLLVRFGLRAADDPRIVNTLQVIDSTLKAETAVGPSWRRYTDDGYGEHTDGAPFDGTGIGRAWPLLTGERGHYELAAAHQQHAEELLAAMERFANESGLISEQIWDAKDIPDRELFQGRPSGSAMPLVWAHAEYVKLQRSIHDGRVFDAPPQTAARYLTANPPSGPAFWRFNQECKSMARGKTLRLEVSAPAVVRWSENQWNESHDCETRDCGLGLHYVDLPTARLKVGDSVRFTFYWRDAGHWEGKNFEVMVQDLPQQGTASPVKGQAAERVHTHQIT
jgi:glucoamylase